MSELHVGDIALPEDGGDTPIPHREAVLLSGEPCVGETIDVRVRARRLGATLRRFAVCQFMDLGRDGHARYSGVVTYAVPSEPAGCFALVGSVAVVLGDLDRGSLAEVLRMHREEIRDRGFDRLEIAPQPDGLLIMYEYGIARIDWTAGVRWHTLLLWNDLPQGVEGDFVRYWSEFAEVNGRRYEGDFLVSLADGRKLAAPPT